MSSMPLKHLLIARSAGTASCEVLRAFRKRLTPSRRRLLGCLATSANGTHIQPGMQHRGSRDRNVIDWVEQTLDDEGQVGVVGIVGSKQKLNFIPCGSALYQ